MCTFYTFLSLDVLLFHRPIFYYYSVLFLFYQVLRPFGFLGTKLNYNIYIFFFPPITMCILFHYLIITFVNTCILYFI